MRGNLWTVLAVVVILSLGLAACGPSQAERYAQATKTAADMFATQTAEAPTPTSTPTNTPTVTPTPTGTPTLTPTPKPLSAADIFALVSPSVAFIDTPAGTGSGVLTEGGYVATNAHVIWPFQKVRVVFSDGSEHLDAPVLNWDLLGDLAIIGPLQTSISPVALVDGEDLIIGSEVFLIGYPGEAEQFPQPTFTRGLISRLREWEPIEMTYFQTDALIAGGQSGGVLVSEEGEIIGISGLSFSEAGFGLVASSADVLPRIERLIAGEDIAGLGDRRVPLEAGQLEHDFTLHNFWDRRMYVINEPIGTIVDIEVEGEQDAAFGLIDVFGNVVVFADDVVSGIETGSAKTELAAPYFVVPFQFSEDPGNFQVRSKRRLVPYNDVDDNIGVTVGQTLPANIDYPFDRDCFVIDLAAGDTINITVDSISINPVLTVDFLGAQEEEVISDDDSGGGLFGLNAKLTYRAPHNGSYFIVVQDLKGTLVGGYFLTVAEAPPDATPAAPRPIPTPITSPLGPMSLYESTQYPFSIQYPAEWTEQPPQVEVGETARFISEQGGGLIITEEDMVAQGFGETVLEEYVDLILSVVESSVQDFQLVSREQIQTQQDLTAEVVTFTFQGGFFKSSRFIYLYENRIAFNATYFAPKGRYEELEPPIDYSLGTFRVGEPGQDFRTAVPLTVLNASLSGEPSTLDPALATDATSVFCDKQLFLGLTAFHPETSEVIPELAIEWSVSGNGSTWTFKMRDDVRWVNYNPETGAVNELGTVNAHDVVYGIKRTLDPKTASDYAYMLYIIKGAEAANTGEGSLDNVGVKAVDDYTVEFTLEQPAGYFPSIVGMWVARPQPKAAIEKLGWKWAEPGNIITNGPYMLESWEHEVSMVMVKNPKYYDAEDVQIERIEIVIVEEASTAMVMYENNELDVMGGDMGWGPPMEDMDRIRADPVLSKELTIKPDLATYYYGFVTTKLPFDNRLVRKAFSAAIDRQRLVDNVTKGGQIPAIHFAPPGIFGAPPVDEVGIGYDPEQAKAWLAEAGYPDGEGFPQVILRHNVSRAHAIIAQAITAMWKETLGVDVKIETQEWRVYVESLKKTTPVEDMPHIFRMSWGADYPDENNWVHEVFNSEAGTNRVRRGCVDPNCGEVQPTKFDELTVLAAEEADPEKRKDLYREAERILIEEETALAPIYHHTLITLTKPWVTVRRDAPMGGPPIKDWRIDVEAKAAATGR